MIDFQIGNHFESRCYSLFAHILFENRPLTHFQTLRDDLKLINVHSLFENRLMIHFQKGNDPHIKKFGRDAIALLKLAISFKIAPIQKKSSMQNAFPLLKTVIFFNIAPIHRDCAAFLLIPSCKID